MEKTAIPKWRRRNIFVKKNLQGKFVLVFSLAVFLGLLLNLSLSYFLIDRELTEALYKIHLRVKTTTELAAPIIWRLGAVTVPLIFIIAGATGYYLTRRIELDLMTFRDTVRRALGGDLTGRAPNDMLTGMPLAFNQAVGSIGSSIKRLKDSTYGLETAFQRLEELVKNRETLPDGELARGLSEITEARESARSELSRFKV